MNRLTVLDSYSSLGGVNKKFVGVHEGRVYVVKEPLHETSLDGVMEAFISKLGNYIGVKCAGVKVFKPPGDLIGSEVVYAPVNNKFLEAKDLVKMKENDVESIVDSLKEYKTSKDLVFRYLQMNVFDYLTYQEDRHTRNFAFLQDTETEVLTPYPLYDNGLAFYSRLSDKELSFVKNSNPITDYQLGMSIKLLVEMGYKQCFRYIDTDHIFKEYFSGTRLETMLDMYSTSLNTIKEVFGELRGDIK